MWDNDIINIIPHHFLKVLLEYTFYTFYNKYITKEKSEDLKWHFMTILQHKLQISI